MHVFFHATPGIARAIDDQVLGRCFDSIDGLAREAGALQGALTGEKQQEIRLRAQAMFGDEAVRAHVHVGQLLRSIGV